MRTPSSHVYEIEFDVLGQRRDEYDTWLETEALKWIAHRAVDGFEVQYNAQRLSPRIRFVFEFESFQEWAAFVESDVHEVTMDRLGQVTSVLNATLWERGSLRLDPVENDTPQRNLETPDSTDIHRTESWYKN